MMALRAAANAEVCLPIDEVFAFLADFYNEYLWVPELEFTEQISLGPIGLGTTYWQLQKVLVQQISDCTITAFEPPRHIMTRAVSLSADTDSTFDLATTDAGTRVTITIVIHPHGVERLTMPFFRGMVNRQLTTMLAQLVAVLDHKPEVASAG